jgi:hypothetical protein
VATKKGSDKKYFTMPNGVKIPVPVPHASEAPQRLVAPLTKIKIATARGVRTYGVRERTLRKYGAIPNRLVDGLKVYAKRIPVYYHDLEKIRNIPVPPEKKEKYFFEEDIKAFVKYVPQQETQIILEKKDGTTEVVTTTQEKVRSGLYQQKTEAGKIVRQDGQGVYIRAKHMARRSATTQERREQQSSGLISAGWQCITLYDVTISTQEGAIKYSGQILGYSKVNTQARPLSEMQEETYNFMLHDAIANHDYNYDDVLEAEVISEDTKRFLS